MTTAAEKVIPARDIPRGQSPMELLTPREMSQTTETRLLVETNRVTSPDPSDTLGNPVSHSLDNTMGPVNARPLQDVRLNHDEGNREERPGRFLTTRAPIGQHVKIFRQLTTPPGHVKERVFPKLVNQDGDAQRYGGLTAIMKDETIFAAYDKAEMRKAKIMVVANSEFVYTSKSLFWPDVIMLAAVDLDLQQSISLAIGVQRQMEMNPITIVFAGINDHLHSRGFLSRLRHPTTAENAVWPAIKDILESMGEVVDATKEGSFNKVALRVVFALSPGYAHLPDGLKFVYAIVALLSEGKYDVIISARIA